MSGEKKYQPKITIKKNKLSMAFSLISFMVGEVVLIEKAIECPVNLEKFPEINEEDFVALRQKQFQILKEVESIELDENESVLLYLIIDIVCRVFVSESNLMLEKRAEEVMEIGKEEYHQVRLSYLHYAQNLINEMNVKFSKNKKFSEVRARLSSQN